MASWGSYGSCKVRQATQGAPSTAWQGGGDIRERVVVQPAPGGRPCVRFCADYSRRGGTEWRGRPHLCVPTQTWPAACCAQKQDRSNQSGLILSHNANYA